MDGTHVGYVRKFAGYCAAYHVEGTSWRSAPNYFRLPFKFCSFFELPMELTKANSMHTQNAKNSKKLH